MSHVLHFADEENRAQERFRTSPLPPPPELLEKARARQWLRWGPRREEEEPLHLERNALSKDGGPVLVGVFAPRCQSWEWDLEVPSRNFEDFFFCLCTPGAVELSLQLTFTAFANKNKNNL